MPFKSKLQIEAERKAAAAINSEQSENGSANTEKNEKKLSGAAAETKVKRDLYEKDNKIEELEKELEALRNKPSSAVVVAPDMELLNKLQAQVDLLSRQVGMAPQAGALKFRQPTPADLQDEAITFTARTVIYIVASCLKNGIEYLPPHKLIIFQYAASDVRKEGREEQIKNFSQYTTNLKTEIEYLRNHPFYNIAFSENTNDMMQQDTKEIQFRTSAAAILQNASPEMVFARAEEFAIPNWRSKSPAELKPFIIQKMSEQYRQREAEIQEDILHRQTLRQLSPTE
jgi:hypothetical protein